MTYSIIIPTLNEELNINSFLYKLQPLRNKAEIILVDGGSTDNTIEISKPFVDKTIATSKGRAKQMNAGAHQASGEILIFLHADTSLPDDALNLIRSSTQPWGRFDIQLSGKPAMLKVIATFMNWRSRLTGVSTGDQVLFISKQLFNEVGGYPEIALMEDISLCSKLKKTSRPYCIEAKVTSSGRRWEQYGVFKTLLLMWIIRLRYFFGEDPEILSLLYSKGLFRKP